MTDTTYNIVVEIAPQAEVYRGIQIHHDKNGYWFTMPNGNTKRAKDISRIRCAIDVIQMTLSAASRCKP